MLSFLSTALSVDSDAAESWIHLFSLSLTYTNTHGVKNYKKLYKFKFNGSKQ